VSLFELSFQSFKPLHYFPGSPVKKDYVVFPKGIENDLRKLRYWVKISVEYVISLNHFGIEQI